MENNPNADAKADAKADPAMKAQAEARTAEIKAQEAQAKAADAGKSKEQIAADKARDEADMAKARAAEQQAKLVDTDPMVVEDAKVLAPVPADMSAGDHLAQKFGNDPANPKPALGEHADPDLATVKLSRKTPDHPDLVYTIVHRDMVGDYCRAGWNVADGA